MYLSPFFTLHVPKDPFSKAEYINNNNKNVTLLINIRDLVLTDIIHGILLNIANLQFLWTMIVFICFLLLRRLPLSRNALTRCACQWDRCIDNLLVNDYGLNWWKFLLTRR